MDRPHRHQELTEVTPYSVRQIVDPIIDSIDELADKPHVGDGFLLENVTLTFGYENWLSHGLGRKVRGYMIASRSAQSNVHWDKTSTADLATHLPLVTSRTVTVSVVVF